MPSGEPFITINGFITAALPSASIDSSSIVLSTGSSLSCPAYSRSIASVMYHMMLAIEREYAGQLKDDPVLKTMLDESIDALGKAAVMKPLIVMNGSPDGIFANHRRNLDAYISEARQQMYSIREELQRSPL